MARYNDRANVTPGVLRSLSGTLQRIAAAHEQLARWMEREKIDAVEAKLMKTEMRALVDLCKFVGSVSEAYCVYATEEGVSEMTGAMAVIHKETKRMRQAVDLAFFNEREAESAAESLAKEAVDAAQPKSRRKK